MIKTVHKPEAADTIKAIASKSEVHRLLICAALSDKKTEIVCESTNEDITATAECLKALGAEITYENGIFTVYPIKDTPENPVLPCNESGSTLRFLIPLTASLGKGATYLTRGRLSSRPLSPLKEELEKGGTEIEADGSNIVVRGKNTSTEFEIAGNVSSQFISGLMLMLTLTGGKITVTGEMQSRPYIEMTADALRLFGCNIGFNDNIISVPRVCPLVSPLKVQGFGDWSNAAFFLCAGAIGKKKITVTGLHSDSRQGDKKIVDILRLFGAKAECEGDSVTVFPSSLHGITFDARDIPDLVPVLSVVAANAQGTTRITGCERLRFKESDRIEAVRKMITDLGGRVIIENDDIIIGGTALSGGETDSLNDHRIAMSAGIASFATTNPVTVHGAEAVNKSYPGFWDELK